MDTTPNVATFDALAAAKNQAYPEDTVNVYLDAASARQAHIYETQINNETDPDEVERLEVLRKDALQAVKDSALTFHLRGVAPGFVTALQDLARTTFPDKDGEQFSAERSEWFLYSLVAEHITQVTNSEGAVDPNTWDLDRVKEFRGAVQDSEWKRLEEAVSGLTFASAYFDAAVTADFS